MAVSLFASPQFQPPEMFAQGITHQSRTVSAGALCGLIGGIQQLFIEYDLNDFHMWNLFHSILYMEDISKQAVTLGAF